MNTTPARHPNRSGCAEKLRRRFFALLGVLCLCGAFFGCMPIQYASPDNAENAPLAQVDAIVAKQLTFWINDQFEPEVLRQADLFADRVEQISGGLLTVSVHAKQPDFADTARGNCDLAFFRNIQLAQEKPAFSTFSLPFLFNSAAHLSNSLNSDEMLTRLRGYLGQSGVTPLGAVYYGSTTLVSDRAALQMPNDFTGRIMGLRTNNTEKLNIFEALGARVLPYSQDSLVSLLGTKVEILPEDLNKPSDIVTIDTVEATFSQMSELPDSNAPVYVMTPGHSATALWLAANSTTWDGLSSWERAVLEEAKAGMFAGIDQYYTAQEADAVTALTQNINAEFFRVEREFMANTIYTSSERFRLPVYFDYKLYSMVWSYG